MGVAVAEIAQHWFAGAVAGKFSRQPDLARATLHLVGGGMLGLRHRIERAAEFDDIPVAVVPILQQRKIVPDFVDRRHHGPHLSYWDIYRTAEERKRVRGNRIVGGQGTRRCQPLSRSTSSKPRSTWRGPLRVSISFAAVRPMASPWTRMVLRLGAIS